MKSAKKFGAEAASKAGTTEKIHESLFDSDSEISSPSEDSSILHREKLLLNLMKKFNLKLMRKLS